MIETEVHGLDDLQALTKALRAAGDQGKGFKRELYRGLNSATKETRADMKAAIPASLPSRGGLAAEVHRTASLTTSTIGGGRNVGVRIKARGKRNLRLMNSGVVRRPLFGNKQFWFSQTAGVRKGFLDDPFEKNKPEVRDAVLEAIQSVARMIDRRV